MRTNRVLLAAAASVLAFALTGCGSDDPGAKVPTAGGGEKSASAPAGGGKDEVAQYVENQRKWVACMRENGFDLPDPNNLGQVEMGDNRALKADPKFQPAQEKCAQFATTVPEAVERQLRPKLTPEQIKTQQKYADCMQKNGAADFPDPDADGYQPANNSGEPDWNQNSASAKRAARTCAPIIGDPVEQGPGKG